MRLERRFDEPCGGPEGWLMTGLAWHVLAVMPRREFAAERDVMDLGFETYIPRQRRSKVYRGRRLKIVEPLLTGYIFVAFDRDRDPWGEIEWADDVWGLLKDGDKPTAVRAGELELLRQAEVAGLFDFTNPGLAYRDGDTVEIAEGHALAGLRAIVKSATGKKRIKVLLKSLGVLDIDPSFLRKVPG
jgi:transcription antitermination factor NusG